MNCNIIQDLLPSYIDGICSEDTVKLVEEHIQHCEECKICVNRMQQQTTNFQQIPEEVRKAINPFKKINTKQRIQVMAAILLTFFITIIGYFIYQDVGVIHDYFSPMVPRLVEVENDSEEWQAIPFTDANYLIYDSVFWKKELVNSSHLEYGSLNKSEFDVLLRVKDENGNVVVDEMPVPSGASVKLDGLKRNEKYFFEIKATKGWYFFNAL